MLQRFSFLDQRPLESHPLGDVRGNDQDGPHFVVLGERNRAHEVRVTGGAILSLPHAFVVIGATGLDDAGKRRPHHLRRGSVDEVEDAPSDHRAKCFGRSPGC